MRGARIVVVMGALTALFAAAGAAVANAPTVETMVAGKSEILATSGTIKAAAANVRIGGRRCAVPAATPLAALLAAARKHGLKVGLRDYGNCSRRAADAGLLFVRGIGGDRNRGADGWVYKVGRRAGTAGAADPHGPFGHGRLHGGEQVLWFWCRNSGGGACQGTLDVNAQVTPSGGGHLLQVTVQAADNDGRASAVEGAEVRADTAVAFSDASGRANLPVAASDSLRVVACKLGLVCSFPLEVGVT